MSKLQRSLVEPDDDLLQNADMLRDLNSNAGDNRDLERRSRMQEERVHEPIHEGRGDQWEQPLNFDYDTLPALPGMVQRMVRIRIAGQEDYQNFYKALRGGWRPRSRASVPEGFYPNLTQLKVDRDYGDVVGDHCMILMERPKALHDRDKAEERKYQQSLDALVSETVEGAPERNQRGLRLSASRENRQSVEYARPADD